jgi:hypothetical protein
VIAKVATNHTIGKEKEKKRKEKNPVPKQGE